MEHHGLGENHEEVLYHAILGHMDGVEFHGVDGIMKPAIALHDEIKMLICSCTWTDKLSHLRNIN